MSLINTETKHHEVNNPVVNVPVNTWTVQQIADVAQGDTELTRDGGKIRAKSILIKGQLNRSGTNTFPLNQVRIAIVQALTDNRTANDVYSPSNGNTIIAPRNLAAATQYKVLWDKTFSLTNTGGNQGVVIDKYIQIDQHISFPPGSTTPERNSYFLMFSSGAVSGATDEFTTWQSFTRLAFIDN
jgi:hypothetical protein